MANPHSVGTASLRKVKDVVIYHDPRFHSAFPSVVRRSDGELLVAFRRAPNRLIYGEARNDHVDPNSYLVLVRSTDSGQTWTKEPALLHADAFGGSQDPGLLQLRDGTLLCTSYGWTFLRPDALSHLKPPFNALHSVNAIFNGGYYLRSTDDGQTWSDRFIRRISRRRSSTVPLESLCPPTIAARSPRVAMAASSGSARRRTA